MIYICIKCFNNTRLLNVYDFWLISECVLANFPRATESNIDLVIGKYLKYAPERAGGGGRKDKNDA